MVVGIAFYKRDQWPSLIEDAADSHILEQIMTNGSMLSINLSKNKGSGARAGACRRRYCGFDRLLQRARSSEHGIFKIQIRRKITAGKERRLNGAHSDGSHCFCSCRSKLIQPGRPAQKKAALSNKERPGEVTKVRQRVYV